ncbi:DnaT-like ssDNA-binding protein [Mesorhizobium australicum]|uniref:DnaT-like ssDNA-binding protein n=1 Tax=Mesorhizobium australicum TaxID=536018 RepID=UPI00333B5127
MAGYGSDVALKAYWDAAGYTYASDAPFAALRQRGSAYIDGTYGMRFPGQPTEGITQEREWPRTGATAYGASLASDLIPTRVEQASYEAAYIELKKPGSLSISFDPAKKVKRQKVEGIEREFFEPGDSSNIFAPDAPISTVIEGLLAPLIGPVFGQPAIMVV